MAEKTCFIIGPIGDPGSSIRKAADQVLNHIITPAVRKHGFEPLRADKIAQPGLVTRQVMQHVIDDPLVVADLTGRNPNVYYELAVRHAIRKPLVQIVGGPDTLPFDVLDTRTIRFDLADIDTIAQAGKDVESQVAALLDDPKPLENPISETLDLQAYRESGDAVQVALGSILEAVTDLRGEVHQRVPIYNFSTVPSDVAQPITSIIPAQGWFSDYVQTMATPVSAEQQPLLREVSASAPASEQAEDTSSDTAKGVPEPEDGETN